MWASIAVAAALFVITFPAVRCGRREGGRRTGWREVIRLKNLFALADDFARGCDVWFLRNAEVRNHERKISEALLETADESFCRRKKRYLMMWGIVFFAAIAGGVIAIHGRKTEAVESILRPGFGEESRITLEVEGFYDVGEVSFSVSGKDPGEEEMEAVFDRVFSELQEQMLNGNESLFEVRNSLDFPESTREGIVAEYQSSDVTVLSDRGFITAEEIPEGGIEVAVRVVLSYRGYEKEYELRVRVLPLKEELTDEGRLAEAIREGDQRTLDEERLQLPQEVEGQAVRYREAGTSPYPVLVLGIGGAAALYVLAKEQQKKRYEKRSIELAESFPGMLSKLSTLISAGMSTRGAWLRITEDYRERQEVSGNEARTIERSVEGVKWKRWPVKSKENGQPVYVYEEMIITAHQLLNGQSEGEAYVDFGKRCGSPSYVRFGNILAKNLRQGISGMRQELQTEMRAALNEKRQTALRRGEEAGTKMLFPMILMLGVVLVAVAAPAFLAF